LKVGLRKGAFCDNLGNVATLNDLVRVAKGAAQAQASADSWSPRVESEAIAREIATANASGTYAQEQDGVSGTGTPAY
jgi:hypothetical protein